jgi:class 3 adenylate cyclase
VSELGAAGTTARAGVHSGECVAVGPSLSGETVAIAAHVATLACPSEVLVSEPVRDLVMGSSILLVAWGSHILAESFPPWHLYAVHRT